MTVRASRPHVKPAKAAGERTRRVLLYYSGKMLSHHEGRKVSHGVRLRPVAFDRLLVSRRGVVGISPKVALRSSLAQQIPALVQVDLHLLEPRLLLVV